jgi:outer membrane receptor protein involved in Fe transport
VVGASLCALTWACARAEGESADPAQVEEVVVTAQRRQQNLQDVPVSVTAAGAAALAAAHVDDVSNIKALSPGVRFTTNYNPAVTSNILVRGVGTVGNSRTFEGAVGVFVDGVYRTRAGQALESFLDVDSLQILSGPQGTLFGKNTSAGAVLMTSASPSITSVRGTYEASYGNYNTGLVKGAVNLPISDKAAFRIAGL